jgi:heme oxygenase
MSSSPETLMGRLRSATTEHHQRAEQRQLQRAMAKGTLPRPTYAAYLSQLFLVHQALELRLRELRDQTAAFGPVFQDDQCREPNLRTDLSFYGADVDAIEPAPASSSIIARIEQAANTHPVALLGMLYVLEGSNNGSKYIARSIARAYNIAPGSPEGLSYLDPYGDNQRPRWEQFKQAMDAITFNEVEQSLIIDAAQAMFDAIADISDEVFEPAPA